MKIRKGFVSNSSSSSFIVSFPKNETYINETDFLNKVTGENESLQESGKYILKELWDVVMSDVTFNENEVDRYFQYEIFKIFDDDDLNEEFTKDVVRAAKHLVKTTYKYQKTSGTNIPYELILDNNEDDKVLNLLQACPGVTLVDYNSSCY